ncbi:hypothetical protein BOX24_04585 [Leptospirillum ferriphilum]|uniref:Uncharacterized protein n=1 Tax=Leptospirillum ferriphilum TaxID=178606 RepID=A0A1V3SWD2_9BACT|nr:hypothetical protein BOX24_04585 [Leptospirillum ferriphilum]
MSILVLPFLGRAFLIMMRRNVKKISFTFPCFEREGLDWRKKTVSFVQGFLSCSESYHWIFVL